MLRTEVACRRPVRRGAYWTLVAITRHPVTSLVALCGSVALSLIVAATPALAKPSSATVSGIAKVTGTPSGWYDSGFYVQACPASVTFSDGCVGGAIGSPPASPGRYSVTLKPVGAWKIGAYYYADHGQLINNTPVALTVKAGEAITKTLTVAYVTPAAEGTVTLTGAPKDFLSKAYMGVQACPGSAAFKVGCVGGTEAYEGISPGEPYSIDLTRGEWKLGAYYLPRTNTRPFTGKPVTITAKVGHTLKQNLSMAYQGL